MVENWVEMMVVMKAVYSVEMMVGYQAEKMVENWVEMMVLLKAVYSVEMRVEYQADNLVGWMVALTDY